MKSLSRPEVRPSCSPAVSFLSVTQLLSTSVSYLFRTTGQVLGVSLTSALSQHVLAANLRARIIGPGAEETIRRILASTSYIHTLPEDVKFEAQTAWALSLKVVFACQVVSSSPSTPPCLQRLSTLFASRC